MHLPLSAILWEHSSTVFLVRLAPPGGLKGLWNGSEILKVIGFPSPLYLGEKEAQNRRRLQAYFRPFSIRIPTWTCQSFTAIYASFSMSSFINCANLKLSQSLHKILRSDSEPTLATLSQGANNNNRRPSIAITRASVERLGAIWCPLVY